MKLDEIREWTECEQAFKKSTGAPTTVQPHEFVDAELELLRRRTTRSDIVGDLSSAMPAIHTDDFVGIEEMAAAAPQREKIKMLPATFLIEDANPWAALCRTELRNDVLDMMIQIQSNLTSHILSGTTYRTLPDFIVAANLPGLIKQEGDFCLFGIYSKYGVVCRFEHERLKLVSFCFTSDQPRLGYN